jgi:serine/threonine protein kinase
VSVRTGEDLYEHLQESRLLTAEQLADIHDEILAKPTLSAGRLANQLIAAGSITLWQAHQLLAGRHDFFVGKYKLLERLGAGGMGTVYKAYHPMTDRVVALKLVSKALLANPPAVARFRTEVRLICSLNHPNIITAYDADRVGDMHFLVMEFGQGRDLRAWLKQCGPLPVDWACDCVRQAALALDHAHLRGLVHRDIKPENILADGPDVQTPPNIKLLDLGLARLMHEEPDEDAELAGAGKLMGTPDYISPEQATQASHADIRSDIYSLGATLYKILTDEVPFEGGDLRQRLMSRLVSDAPRASSRRDDLPDEVDEIVARMLAREPANRYQTPAEVAEALFPFTFEGQKVTVGAIKADAVGPGDSALGSFFNHLAEEQQQPVAIRNETKASGPARSAAVVAPLPACSTASADVQPRAKEIRGGSRRGYGRRNWVVGVVAGCALSVPAVGLIYWVLRPATLVLAWPLDQRRGSQLLVDGVVQSVPKLDPAEVSIPSGAHRIVLRRRGYDPIEWNLDLRRGTRIDKKVEWNKTDLSRPFKFGSAAP